MSETKQNSTQETATADARQVVAVAAEYIKSLMGEIGGLRLEEIEQKSNGLGWLVTLSYIPQLTDRDFPFINKREYKQVEVGASGQPLAMRIRKIE